MRASDHGVDVTFPTDTEILFTRVFAAPRELIFRAWTTPDLLRRWWAGGRGTMSVAELDLRVHGRWRFVLATGDGSEYGFHGEYLEIEPHRRIVYTEVFENEPEAQALTTVTFGAVGDGTRLAVLVRYGSQRERDAHVRYMADGLQESLDLLEQSAVSLPRPPPSASPVATPIRASERQL